MSYRVDFHEAVENDFLEAYTWYEGVKEGLGERFLLLARAKLEQIERNPETFSEKTKRGHREAKLEAFPYMIVYKLYKKDKVIFVNSIVHQRKHPRKRYRK